MDCIDLDRAFGLFFFGEKEVGDMAELTIKVEARIRNIWLVNTGGRLLGIARPLIPYGMYISIANWLLGLIRIEHRIDKGKWRRDTDLALALRQDIVNAL